MAHDVIKELELRRKMPETSLLLLDAPTGGHNLTDKNAHFTRFVPQLWTPKWMNRLVLGRDKTLPAHEPFDDPEEEQRWLRQVAASRSFPFLYLLGGQVRYIVRHPGPQKTVLGDVPMAFIQSANDTIIERNAPISWMEATGRTVPVITAQTKFHADLLEFPREWARCITIGINYVLSN